MIFILYGCVVMSKDVAQIIYDLAKNDKNLDGLELKQMFKKNRALMLKKIDNSCTISFPIISKQQFNLETVRLN